MNKVILIGNLTKDPTLTDVKNNKVCKFLIAINRYNDKVDFVNITVFSTIAENCAKYLSKGKKVGVVGSLQTREWQDESGKKQYFTEVVANEVEFLSAKDRAAEFKETKTEVDVDLSPIPGTELPF